VSFDSLPIVNQRQVPTEEDWGDWESDDGLDLPYAHKIFAGKTNEEVRSEFEWAVLERAFEIMSMPCKPFQYYVFGLRDLVIEKAFNEYELSDAASVFFSTIESRFERAPEHIVPIFPELLEALNFVAENQDAYDASVEIYGDFKERLGKINQSYLISKERLSTY